MQPLAIILWTLVYNSLQLPIEQSVRLGASLRKRSVAAGLRAPLLEHGDWKTAPRSFYKKVRQAHRL